MNFKDIFLESEEDDIRQKMKLGPEYAFYYKGKWIIDSFHKLDRTKERGSTSEDFFKKAIDWIVDNKKGKGHYLFVSKSSFLGMVIDYRKDDKHRVKGNNLIIVTWLGDIRKKPINKKSVKDVFTKNKSDIKIILEYTRKHIEFDEFVELD